MLTRSNVMVHILPLVNISGFTPEFDKKNWIHIQNHNGLLVEYANTGHGIYERYKRWYRNGQIWKNVNYKNGQRHGRSRWWCDNGNLIADEVWENGKLVKG